MSLLIENVSKRFISKHKETFVLDNINLLVNKGEFLCLLGPSGCGKSTLLNIIAGLDKASEGKIYLNNHEINGTSSIRAMMFQESALFPWLKVIDNVEFGMKMTGIPKQQRRETAMKYLQMVHLTKFQNSYVHELSGGMKQRVALARALTLDSELLLMDEPFASLDTQTKSILLVELQKIWMETGKTIIFVTHNVDEAALLAGRIVVMAANPGKIKQIYKVNIARPRTIDNIDLSYTIKEIINELKEEVEKVAKEEYDNGWNFEQNNILCSADNNMGANI